MRKNTEYGWIFSLATLIIVVLIIGFALAFSLGNFAFLPFAVVIMGIITFFTVLKFSKALTGSNESRMRKAITVSIVVVYLGLLPTLAFQGILQFQVTGNTTTAILNQTVDDTVIQSVPQSISLSETVVSSFTALVAAVLLFYFGSRSIDGYIALKGKNDPTTEQPSQEPSAEDPTKTEKEVTVAEYDKDENLVKKTVTTERIKKI